MATQNKAKTTEKKKVKHLTAEVELEILSQKEETVKRVLKNRMEEYEAAKALVGKMKEELDKVQELTISEAYDQIVGSTKMSANQALIPERF